MTGSSRHCTGEIYSTALSTSSGGAGSTFFLEEILVMILVFYLYLDLLGLVRLIASLIDLLVAFVGVLHTDNPMRATPVMPAPGSMTMTAEHNDTSTVPVMVMATMGTDVSAVNPRHNVSGAMMAVVIIMIVDRQTIESTARTNNRNANNGQ